MNTSALTVLLVTDGARNAPVLQEHLQTRGCHVFFASSHQEAVEMLSTREFRLVLSEFILSDGTAFRLVPLLRGTATTMFFSDAVEDGYWWMLALHEGEDHWGEPGMRSAQFRKFWTGSFSTRVFWVPMNPSANSQLTIISIWLSTDPDSGTPSCPTAGALPPRREPANPGIGKGAVPCEISILVLIDGISYQWNLVGMQVFGGGTL
jgi:hypothetical protein